LNVSPQSAHRHAVSFVICLASVPTRVDPQTGQVGLFGSSVDMKTSDSTYECLISECLIRAMNALGLRPFRGGAIRLV
jgi:hypothetical protein